MLGKKGSISSIYNVGGFPHLLYNDITGHFQTYDYDPLFITTPRSQSQCSGQSNHCTHLVSPAFAVLGNDIESKMEELRGAGPSVSAEFPVFSLSERQDLRW